jgi:catechol 2,3-dioxygenase-like lactoylglutathione lyase family enzyme
MLPVGFKVNNREAEMIRHCVLIAASLALAGSVIPLAMSGQSPHGGFTGEVKPVIYVADVERSAPFYRDVLGFELDGFSGDEADPYYAEMLAGRLKFGLHEPTVSGDEERVGRQRLYFRVRDLEAHHRYVEERGAEAGEIIRRSWMDFFTVRDPDGNEIVFAVTDPERHTSQPWSREDNRRDPK